MSSRLFGFSKLVNENVSICEISNENGMVVNIITLGAAIQAITLPWSKNDSNNRTNVVLGFDNVEDYDSNPNYIGVAVGRVAGRISHAEFNADGKCWHVTDNHCGCCLHGGRIGLSRKNWKIMDHDVKSVTLKCSSPHLDDGFPGELNVSICYTISPNDSLIIKYTATVVGDECPVNLTNHSYFNLTGIENVERGVKDHVVSINASKTLEVNEDLLPSGRIINMPKELDLKKNTVSLDLLLPNTNGNPKGFDNYYIFDDVGITHCQATVSDGYTRMSLFTDQNGVQFYTSNFFSNVKVAGGFVHHQYGALCLEAQNFPDSVSHCNFPSIILKPGQTYSQETVYKFEKFK